MTRCNRSERIHVVIRQEAVANLAVGTRFGGTVVDGLSDWLLTGSPP